MLAGAFLAGVFFAGAFFATTLAGTTFVAAALVGLMPVGRPGVRALAEARLLTVPEPTSVHLDVAAEVGGLDGWIG